MSIANEIEKLASNLRDTRNAIVERGGEISETAGLKDLPEAILHIPEKAAQFCDFRAGFSQGIDHNYRVYAPFYIILGADTDKITTHGAAISGTYDVLVKSEEDTTYKMNTSICYAYIGANAGIANYCFEACNKLERLYVSIGVKTLGNCAFANCTKLSIVKLPPSLKKIANQAFYGCTKLTDINLPDSITEIGSWAFEASGLTSIEIPKSCKTLGRLSFGNNSSLRTVKFRGKPTTIDSFAFGVCSNLKEIYVPWSAGEVADAPWGASNATIYYNAEV